MTREEIEKVAQHAMGAAQRLGMQIAEKPLDQREEVEGLMKFQMEAVRGMVMSIDRVYEFLPQTESPPRRGLR